jgi:hypothetical protein
MCSSCPAAVILSPSAVSCRAQIAAAASATYLDATALLFVGLAANFSLPTTKAAQQELQQQQQGERW